MSYEQIEQIKERYLKNYITDSQLERFLKLGIITDEEFNELWKLKHGENEEE